MFWKRFRQAQSAGTLFKQANEHWRKMQAYVEIDESRLCDELAQVVYFCQQAIHQDSKCGDAYILLANALTSAASHGPSQSNLERYEFLQSRAAATIHLWYTLPHRSYPITTGNNTKLGDSLWDMIVGDICHDKNLQRNAAISLIESYRDTLAAHTISPDSYEAIYSMIVVPEDTDGTDQVDDSPNLLEPDEAGNMPRLIENEVPVYLQYLFPKILGWAISGTDEPQIDPIARMREITEHMQDDLKLCELNLELVERIKSASRANKLRDVMTWFVWLLFGSLYLYDVVRQGHYDEDQRNQMLIAKGQGVGLALAASREAKDWDALILATVIYFWLDLADVTDEILQFLREEAGKTTIDHRLEMMIQQPQSLLDRPFAKTLKKYLDEA